METKKKEITTEYSLIIPVYNEEKRIREGIESVLHFIKSRKLNCELLIVDDGSIDRTKHIAKSLLTKFKSSRLIESNHLGKGGALKTGVKQAKGKWVLFFDVDLATPMDELLRFRKFQNTFDIIIGSRKMKGAKIITRQPFFREFSGRVFTWLTNAIVTKNISDVTCGFKLFKTVVAKNLFSKSKLSDWSFDAEILFLAQKHSCKIKEIPVTWKDDPHTKVNLIRDTIDAFLGLLKIRIFDLQGKYS